MTLGISHIGYLVRNYDEAIAYFVDVLGFELLEDTPRPGGKRWVRVALPGSGTPSLILSRAVTPEQLAQVGNQAGGRVFLFLESTDFHADYERLRSLNVEFTEEPREEAYGLVAVFRDLYGNRWDLLGYLEEK